MAKLAGLTKQSRARLSLLLRNLNGNVTPSGAARLLNVTQKTASLRLAKYARNGWLTRVKRGYYVPVDIEAEDPTFASISPWTIATNSFSPCYIGGWSALEYWGFTEQIYNEILVFTARSVRKSSQLLLGNKFKLKRVTQQKYFGLKTIWIDDQKVSISDPTKTIADILSDIDLAGGIRPAFDALKQYLASEYKNLTLLNEYTEKLNNKTIYKRLGFLMERIPNSDKSFLKLCKEKLSTGNSKLDPTLGADYLVTKWKLWVPKNWKEV
jgi:predicted transcriptional regulator of viral defense system